MCSALFFVQPDDDLVGLLVDVAHEWNLMVQFRVVVLVETDRIDPEIRCSLRATTLIEERLGQIRTDTQLTISNKDGNGAVLATPSV